MPKFQPKGKRFNETTKVIGFGVKDRFKRELGIYIARFEEEAVLVDDNARWGYAIDAPAVDQMLCGCYCMATRDGSTYGACQSASYFTSVEAREKYIEKRIKSSKRTAEKRAAVEAKKPGKHSKL